jgi:Ni,Fe-hydrogenase III small subunit
VQIQRNGTFTMFSKIVLIAGLIALVYSQTPARQCGSGKPVPINVNFNNCTAEPCNVYRGIIGVTEIRFTSRKYRKNEIIFEYA